jgi:regulator of sigma E protease
VSWFLAFAGFAVLVILHEAGHFAAAKAVGMRVERFSLFFGPMLVKVRRGETEYGIAPIPLGGYVKISGMNPRENLPPEVVPRAYFNQPVWKRIVVIAAGPAVNLVLAFLIIGGLFWARGTQEPTTSVAQVSKGTPAATVLQPGDRIVSADGRTGNSERIRASIDRHRCAGGAQKDGCVAATPVKLVVVRDGARVPLTVRPRWSAADNRMLVGFAFDYREQPAGPIRASGLAVSTMWTVTSRTVSTIARIFEPKERKQVSSVVGGYKVTQQSFAESLVDALFILGLISLSLGVINLFPFLPLDGGHIFWALAEKVRGRRIPFSVMERAGVVGFALVIMLFLVGLSNDVSRLSNGGFNVR